MYKYNPFTGTLDITSKEVWTSLDSTVSASSTGVIDTVANTAWESLKYIIVFYNGANNAYRSLELSVINSGGAFKDSVSTRLSNGPFNIKINANNNAGNLELEIINNETFNVNVKAAKLLLA